MKLNAVGVTAKNLKESTKFYELLGFKFQEFKDDEQHVDSIPEEGSIRLMIDSIEMIEGILGEKPTPSNHSTFALEYNSSSEVDDVINKLKQEGYNIVKEPWDAFWGQRYAIVKDPNGYMVDLYAYI